MINETIQGVIEEMDDAMVQRHIAVGNLNAASKLLDGMYKLPSTYKAKLELIGAMIYEVVRELSHDIS